MFLWLSSLKRHVNLPGECRDVRCAPVQTDCPAAALEAIKDFSSQTSPSTATRLLKKDNRYICLIRCGPRESTNLSRLPAQSMPAKLSQVLGEGFQSTTRWDCPASQSPGCHQGHTICQLLCLSFRRKFGRRQYSRGTC